MVCVCVPHLRAAVGAIYTLYIYIWCVCVRVPHLRAAVGAIYILYIYIWCVCARAPPACSGGWLSGASEGAGMVANEKLETTGAIEKLLTTGASS